MQSVSFSEISVGCEFGVEIEYLSESEAETISIAEKLGATLEPGDVVLLIGELGAGKTVFSKGIGAALKVDPTSVKSPSFTLMNVYKGVMPVVHLDLYRLSSFQEFEQAGLLDVFSCSSATIVEWPDRIPEIFVDMIRLEVVIEAVGRTSRKITIRKIGGETNEEL
jgi:tRNA threonylcarbamoyladenosine biosynthesis protein TsaE